MANAGILLKVSKLEAAHTQLRAAIRMWAYDEDPVSTHTLAFAAYEIAHSVSKRKSPARIGLLLDSEFIHPDKRKEFNKLFREAANFFKHADRDPDGSIEFAPSFTELFICYAIRGLELCGITLAPELKIFMYWLQVRTPALMSNGACEVIAQSNLVHHFREIQTMPKHEFFEALMYSFAKRDAA